MYYVGTDGKVRKTDQDGKFLGIVRLDTGRALSVNTAWMRVFAPHIQHELDDGGQIMADDIGGVRKLMEERTQRSD